MSGFDVTVNCTSCSQTLVLSARDLRAAFTCPRCGHTMPATALVRLSTPVRAVPAAVRPLVSQEATWGSPNSTSEVDPRGVQATPQATGRTPHGVGHMDAPVAQCSQPSPASPYPQAPALPHAQIGRSAASAGTNAAHAADHQQRHRTRPLVNAVAGVLGNVTWWLDRVTYGRRLLYLSVAGAVVLTTKHFAADAYVPALFLYCSFLYLLLLARLWWVRDEAGKWTWGRFADRSIGLAHDAFAGLIRVEELSLQYLLEQLQLAFLACGLALTVIAPPLGALAHWLVSPGTVTAFLSALETVGLTLFGLGLVPWLLKHLRGRSAAAKSFKQAALALGTRESLSRVPLIVDLRQPDSWTGGVPVEFQPLLGMLARWRPRESARESGYERSLVRFLERSIRGIEVQTQLPFQSEDGTRGRIDVVLDDVVAIELKRDLRASADADRAVGQVLKYAASWRKGPVMLLLVEASAEVADLPVLKRIAELREGGRSLFVVAAGRFRQ